MERSRTMKNLYLNIRKAAEQIAAERGFKIVFVDDSIAPIPAGTSEEMTRQISARRMVYTSPEVDITDVLIKRLNDSFKTAGPAKP
jgi:Skp family chaperone for outer membrane proteins